MFRVQNKLYQQESRWSTHCQNNLCLAELDIGAAVCILVIVKQLEVSSIRSPGGSWV